MVEFKGIVVLGALPLVSVAVPLPVVVTSAVELTTETGCKLYCGVENPMFDTRIESASVPWTLRDHVLYVMFSAMDDVPCVESRAIAIVRTVADKFVTVGHSR